MQPPKEVGGTPVKSPPPKRTKPSLKDTPPDNASLASQGSAVSKALSASPSVFYRRETAESNLALQFEFGLKSTKPKIP